MDGITAEVIIKNTCSPPRVHFTKPQVPYGEMLKKGSLLQSHILLYHLLLAMQ